jgi:hypothetical protein
LNCGTRLVTTLALLSATKVARSPVLLINCESRDGSYEHFARLATKYRLDFYWLEWPLRPHGVALDQLFREVTADTVLLVDSDLEIADESVIVAMRDAVHSSADAYGSGFVHGPYWMGEDHGMHAHAGFYAERMWIPCVLLRTSDIKQALAEGQSFSARRTYHDFANHPLLSRLAAWRFKLPMIRRWPIHRPRMSGMNSDSEEAPCFVEYDTGADLHNWFKSHGKSLAALPTDFWGGVKHFHGVTRATLASPLLKIALAIRRDKEHVFTQQNVIAAEIKERIRTLYGVSLDDGPNTS